MIYFNVMWMRAECGPQYLQLKMTSLFSFVYSSVSLVISLKYGFDCLKY